jgi:hypothetical protein
MDMMFSLKQQQAKLPVKFSLGASPCAAVR